MKTFRDASQFVLPYSAAEADPHYHDYLFGDNPLPRRSWQSGKLPS
jgi:hypothetical protein